MRFRPSRFELLAFLTAFVTPACLFSVLAPIPGVAVSMTFGIGALLLSSVPVYLAVGLAVPEEPRVGA